MDAIQIAQEKFAELIRSEFERIERMKADNEITDFSKLDEIVVGVLPGDGIGPIIMEQAQVVATPQLSAACQDAGLIHHYMAPACAFHMF